LGGNLIRCLFRFGLLGFLFSSSWAYAGYLELSANGSYYKQNNGLQDGEISTAVTTRVGAGIAYRFLSQTAIEIAYLKSTNQDKYGQDIVSEPNVFFINRETETQNISLNLILYFAGRQSAFRPYIRGGAGYMTVKTIISGTSVSRLDSSSSPLTFAGQPNISSISADGGLGIDAYVADQLALEASFTVYGTDLDKPQIYLHYSLVGGIKLIF